MLPPVHEDGLQPGGAVVSIDSIGAEYAGNPHSARKAALQAWSAGMAERPSGPRPGESNEVTPMSARRVGAVAPTSGWERRPSPLMSRAQYRASRKARVASAVRRSRLASSSSG